MYLIEITYREANGRERTDTHDLTKFSRFEDLRNTIALATSGADYTVDHQIVNPPYPHNDTLSLVEAWGMYQISKRRTYALIVDEVAAAAVTRAADHAQAQGIDAHEVARDRAAALMGDLYGVLVDYDVSIGWGKVADALAVTCLFALTCDEEPAPIEEDEPRIVVIENGEVVAKYY